MENYFYDLPIELQDKIELMSNYKFNYDRVMDELMISIIYKITKDGKGSTRMMFSGRWGDKEPPVISMYHFDVDQPVSRSWSEFFN